ncbi:hypothetical protein TWF718_008772 [Orbilia javanica]|uniref:B30.2/SPRY domain-containing protein n=1 Tax=Orbilia javanica TaxID=47235 RepID=A0AAN8RC13_9PEZI
MIVSTVEVSVVEGSAKPFATDGTQSLQNGKPFTRPSAHESACWSEAKVRFRTKLLQTVPRPSEENIERFLKNNNQIDETISECENLKSVADRQYHGSTSSKFIGKLLEVLVVVKNVGDPLLQCAPESVSIAWSAISLLIGLGVNDIENCSRISEACTSIVTIVLNCRLYENRYQNEESNSKIIEAVQELLSSVLDFFWLANKKLRDKKIKRLFKDIFDSKVNETYQDVITRYKALREDTDLAFQERVMESLLDMKKEKEDIVELLFPALKDIKTNLEELVGATKEVLSEIQIREKFKRYRKNLKPTDTHSRQLASTLQPFQHGTEHLCQWLFRHKYYQCWESIPKSDSKKSEEDQMSGETHGEAASRVLPQSEPEPPSPNILYIKGRAGFGKSVMMASVIGRLQNLANEADWAPSLARVNTFRRFSTAEGTSNQAGTTKGAFGKHPVIYFFFKRGDNSTQLTSRGLSSLVTQLFSDDYAKTKKDMEAFMDAMDSVENEGKTPGKTGGDSRGKGTGLKPNQETTPSTTSNQDILKIESIAAAVGRTVYIIIDGIDESTDHDSEGLVKKLIDLGRSTKASFKILLSSRENMGLEKSFVKEGDQEGQKKLEVAVNSNLGLDLKTQDPFYCLIHDDFTILTVTKETNSEDMKTYLSHSLKNIMRRRLPEISQLEKSDPLRMKLEVRIKLIAEGIQNKSDGMFTYSAMVIANIGQPSPMSLAERLRNLPSGMNELYSRQLEALTGAERRLVTLALRRIVWSPTEMGTVEIAEEFKQIYLKEIQPGNEDDFDDFDSRNIDANEYQWEDFETAPVNSQGSDVVPFPDPAAFIGGLTITIPQIQNSEPPKATSHKGTYQDTYLRDTLVEKAMRNPEIADTIYHLESAGRDFFKFTNKKRTIGLIHKSVRDWFESESERSAEKDHGIKSVASLFSHDAESGELKLTLPIPWIVVKNQSEFMEFQSEKDAQLDILIYIMKVLTHPRFQEVYLPYQKPLKALEEQEAKRLEATDPQQSPIAEQPPKDQKIDNSSAKNPAASNEGTSNNKAIEQEKTKPFIRKTRRCEIHQWIHHMRLVGRLWPREERNGKKWTELRGLLRKFCDPGIFKPWFIQYRHMLGYSVQELYRMAATIEMTHIAAEEGLEVFMDFIINETNIDIRKPSPEGVSVLDNLSILHFPDIVKLILEKNIDVNMVNNNGLNPLAKCFQAPELWSNRTEDNKAVQNITQTLKHLVNYGVNLDNRLPNQDHIINNIIRLGDESLFDLAMERNPTICKAIFSWKRLTALHCVWSSNASPPVQVSIARKLLAAGADPNAQSSTSVAPLSEAAFSLNKEGVELLLKEEYKVDINDEDVNGYTALTRLADNYTTTPKALEIIKLLIEHKINIRSRSKNGFTGLMQSLYRGHFEIAEALMAAHSKEQGDGHSYLTGKDASEETILHYTATEVDKAYRVEIARRVLGRLTTAEISVFLEERQPWLGRTALQKSLTDVESLEFSLYLIERGANIHAVDDTGEPIADTFFELWKNTWSAGQHDFSASRKSWTKLYCTLWPTDTENAYLHQAIFSGDTETIRELAEAGIDPLKKDSEGWDAFDWAYTCQQQGMMGEYFPSASLHVDYQLRIEQERDRPEDELPFVEWDPKHCGPFSEISSGIVLHLGEKVRSYFNEELRNLSAVRTKLPVRPYAKGYYYEITVWEAESEEMPGVVVGFAGGGAPTDRLPGTPHESIATCALHAYEGVVYASKWVGSNYPKKLEAGIPEIVVGDTIGCGYDSLNHTLYWTLNGQYLGSCEGLHIYGRLYPIVGAEYWASVRTNFGDDPDEPLKWDGSRKLQKEA